MPQAGNWRGANTTRVFQAATFASCSSVNRRAGACGKAAVPPDPARVFPGHPPAHTIEILQLEERRLGFALRLPPQAHAMGGCGSPIDRHKRRSPTCVHICTMFKLTAILCLFV